MTKRKRVCLVTSGHLASNPRIVKEADALDTAGYDVLVVAANHVASVRLLDGTVLARASWRCVGVDGGVRFMGRLRRMVAQLARRLGDRRLSTAVAAHSAFTARLAAALEDIRADLYIAHNLAALPAAQRAARRCQARLGFDAEDYHPGELSADAGNRIEIENRIIILGTLLPDCDHLTAASPLITAEYENQFGVAMTTVLNVFPRRADPLGGPTTQSDEHGLRFYWFSQTVSRDRGLEEFLAVMAHLQHDASLVVQGHVGEPDRIALDDTAATLGLKHPIRYLPTIPPDEIVDSARAFDVGLSVEQAHPLNRALCLTNKIFVYLQAGLPQVLSDTPAQRDMVARLGDAAVLIDLSDPNSAAQRIEACFADHQKRRHAAQVAVELGQQTYCWEIEQHKFLRGVAECLTPVK